VGEALGRRHDEARRVDEGIELEQVEPRQVGIAQPRPSGPGCLLV
jgi:hypothetical protein